MDAHRVTQAVEQGLAFPCAMCVNHWRAVDAGAESCGKATCGGPLSSRTFPDYEGPLPDGNWSHFCFLTGKPSDLVGVKVVGEKRMLAITRAHKGIFEQCSATGAIDCIQVTKPVLLLDGVSGDSSQANSTDS